ncbi:hypothetical protein BAUCODRAFT_204933 [Baudoinia panamericana UAMH 10762]|uniref:Heterokaryon incompatibility domain-containing protein n=1 Tax=Baudoinia panamericana (strain UAMH 10762) TaxID=717646 RepID=M2NP16_BAUPA|nr:uncharacterized protein BAUCODRAFT_204933 [Baudoinia panamericana UAMH 10762]EMD01290.1 hypothetical protein BAUCODRAFT_204933 [Baudoinia panamericana UAMH 10762]
MDITLIIEAEKHWTGVFEVLAGRRWRISSNHNVRTSSYHCVSYTWGIDRAPNVFGVDGNVSSNTRRSLEAAIASTKRAAVSDQAFWIDAVCVPREGVSRRATLESMGNIYSSARSTIVVLQSTTWEIISRDARSNEPYSEIQLDQLNEDNWINSVWTYQELVNARAVSLTAVGLSSGRSIKGDDFLNCIGFSLDRYKRQHSLSALAIRRRYPVLDAFEDSIADWMVAGYMDRSMLACLTGVAGRYCDPARPTNRMYALLGALTQVASWGAVDENVSQLVQRAMGICDGNGDFSYIYTTNQTQDRSRKWRPDAESDLLPVLRWHIWGDGQPGTTADGIAELQEMVRLDLQTEPSPEVHAHVSKWLCDFAGFHGDQLGRLEAIESELPRTLRSIGFTGSAVCQRCRTGFVLTQEEIQPHETVEAYVSSSIRWAFGTPGIAQVRDGGTDNVRYIVVVHVGPTLRNEPEQSVLLL